VQTPTDFQGYDRRFVGRGLYLETLVGESVQVYVAIDTSGSIGNDEMKMFLGEVLGILNAYPHIKCYLYYADADIYGPYDINKHDEIPVPKGGGGTSFVPFFDEKERNFNSEGVCVYLTDGYGSFPQNQPSLPVLWIVTPGGLDLKEFPFGEAVRLLSL
jgi:predicted metal-dependent peptidase